MTAPPARRPLGNNGDQGYVLPRTGELVPSVTTILKNTPKPVIIRWAAKCAAEYAVTQREEYEALPENEQIQKIKSAPWTSRDKSADLGDLVHDLIEHWIKGDPISRQDLLCYSHEAQGMYRQFLAFQDRFHPEYICSEVTVYNDAHLFAGTLDWMAMVRQLMVLGDTKTGRGVYPEAAMQLAAYAHPDNYIVEDDGSYQTLPRPEAYAVLQLRPEFAIVHSVKPGFMPEAEKAFLGLRDAYGFFDANPKSFLREAAEISA